MQIGPYWDTYRYNFLKLVDHISGRYFFMLFRADTTGLALPTEAFVTLGIVYFCRQCSMHYFLLH